MTVTDQDFVDELRTFIGTPYVHQGRDKGVGVDCAGLIVVAAQNLGVTVVDTSTYRKARNGTTLSDALATNCTATSTTDRRIATILEFQMDSRGDVRHLAVATDVGMIHAYATNGRVCEHVIDQWWHDRIVNVWEITGVTYNEASGAVLAGGGD